MDAIVDESNELAVTFNKLFGIVTSFNPFEFLQAWIPALGYLVGGPSMVC